MSDLSVFLAAMGGTYEFVKTASANLREKEDHWNVALGGFFSGAILGLRGLFFFLLFCVSFGQKRKVKLPVDTYRKPL